jgi:hypothetical protein
MPPPDSIWVRAALLMPIWPRFLCHAGEFADVAYRGRWQLFLA